MASQIEKFRVLDLLQLDLRENDALNLKCIGGRPGLIREISVTEINRPGLELGGFYENFAHQVELGQAKVAEARLKAARLGLELEQSRREKEMAKFASDFSFDPKGLHSDLARAEELINRKIDANRAVGEVAADMSKQTLINADTDEAERKAAAAEILSRLGRKALTSDKPNQ